MEDKSKSSSNNVQQSTSVVNKRKRTLKQLLKDKPVFSTCQSAPSTSTAIASEGEIDNKKISEDNEYVVRPAGGCTFFHETELVQYYEDFRSNENDRYFISKPEDLTEMSLVFKNTPVVRNNYTQYNFTKIPTLALTTNAYGLVIGNSEDFTDRTILHTLTNLQSKHRVTLLLPACDYWWNKNSAVTFKSFIERMGTTIKSLAADAEFKTSMQRFQHNRDVLLNFKNKYISATKVVNNATVPAVFGVKIYNSNQYNSVINVPMATVLDDNSLEISEGHDLLPPTYMHTLLLVSITGFKITRSGISLDTDVNYLIYRPLQRLQRVKPALFTLQQHVIHPKKTRFVSDNKEDENTNAESNSFDMVW